MKTNIRLFICALSLATVTACSSQPPATPTPIATPSLTPPPTLRVVDTLVATPAVTSTPVPLPTITPMPVMPGTASGPYGVILVEGDNALNIRSAPGMGNSLVGSFPATYINVMRTGPSLEADGSLWVEVNTLEGKTGWVNSEYLTEYVTPSAFCADKRALSVIQDLDDAIRLLNGQFLASLASPKHGMDIWLWNSGNNINFDAEHARWIFESTYIHDWGAHPASGLETSGTFHDVVLPELQGTFMSNAEYRCNDPSIPGYGATWPARYANVNFYQVYRPGSPGVDLDWNAWLVGVEYVEGEPYLFALIHFLWTP